MNLNENINIIKQMMGIITENKSISKMIDELGVIDSINFVGDEETFKEMGGMDSAFEKADELLKDYTKLVIVNDYEDKSGDTWKSVAYGRKNSDAKPPYVYFDWSKSPMNADKANLDIDIALSSRLTPLKLPDNLEKIILYKWVKKYYNNIPPIKNIQFGRDIGYNNDGDDRDFSNLPYIGPTSDDVEYPTISEEEIIKHIKDVAEKYSKEDYDDVFDWMDDVFNKVEDKLDREYGVDGDGDGKYYMDKDLRKNYDYILLDMWGEGHTPYREINWTERYNDLLRGQN
jgi:hypothetical protein